jgi:hypothetical protein
VAFGNVYVGKAIAEMHEDDREDVAQFAFEALRALAFTVRPPEAQARRERERAEQKGERQTPRDPSFRMALENAGIDPADYMKGMQEAREAGIEIQQEPGTIHAFKDLMMPARSLPRRRRHRAHAQALRGARDPHLRGRARAAPARGRRYGQRRDGPQRSGELTREHSGRRSEEAPSPGSIHTGRGPNPSNFC